MEWLLNGAPRPVQLEALKRADHKRGWGHWLEMRLGKTSTTLNEFANYSKEGLVDWLVVIAPNSFKHGWQLECAKWGCSIPVVVHNPSRRKTNLKELQKHPKGVFIINYEAFIRSAVFDTLKPLQDKKFMLVADESVKLKSSSSKLVKNILSFSKWATFKRCLSGKPTTEGPHDLYNQLRFLGALSGWTPTTFKAAFAKMGGYMGQQVVGVKNEDRLREIMDRYGWAARKVDWIEGFEKPDYVQRHIPLHPDQELAYRAMEEEFMVQLTDGTIVEAEQVVTKLIKMSQIASGFVIDASGQAVPIIPLEANMRVAELARIIEEDVPGKVIVFCNFVHSIELLRDALAAYQPATIYGKTADIEAEKHRFNNDDACRVLIGQIRASKYGHTLVGSENMPCLTAVYYENTYSLDDRAQTEERNQYGDRHVCPTVIDFYSTGLDQQVIDALQSKEDVAARVMGFARDTGILPRK